jgi:hypothetical protein
MDVSVLSTILWWSWIFYWSYCYQFHNVLFSVCFFLIRNSVCLPTCVSSN